ncbi:MAG: hypothetical protein E6G92_05660 [Alphaproteobacteria bacterium]|nr:MAG: hypothetical protein E6G92_05660 [Alphaproteobacteria bacterium]
MKLKFLMMLLALACVGTAEAQRRILLGREVTTAEAARTLHDFARCVIIRAPGRARALLAMDFTSDEYQDRIRTFAQSYWQCVPQGHRLGFSRLPFAGDLAEQLLLLDAHGADLATQVAYDPARPPLAARSEQEAMALCAVRAAPQKVSALLATRPFSAEEAGALRALTPEAQSCLAAGVRLSLNGIALRAMLGLAAYRLAEHNRAPATRSAAAGS